MSLVDNRIAAFFGNVGIRMCTLLYHYINSAGACLFKGGDVLSGAGKVRGEFYKAIKTEDISWA